MIGDCTIKEYRCEIAKFKFAIISKLLYHQKVLEDRLDFHDEHFKSDLLSFVC